VNNTASESVRVRVSVEEGTGMYVTWKRKKYS
jgi:hypothetical protein